MGAPSKIRGRRATPGPGHRIGSRKTPQKTSGPRSGNSSLDDETGSSNAAYGVADAAESSAAVVAATAATAATATSVTATGAHRSRSRRARSLPRARSLHRALSRVTHWSPTPVESPEHRGINDEALHKEKLHVSVDRVHVFESTALPVDNQIPTTSKPETIIYLKPSLKRNDSLRLRNSARRIRFVLSADPTEGHVRPTRLRRGSPFRGRRASSGSSSDGRGDDQRTMSWRRPDKNALLEADASGSLSRTPSPTSSSPTRVTPQTDPQPRHRIHCSNVLHPPTGEK